MPRYRSVPSSNRSPRAAVYFDRVTTFEENKNMPGNSRRDDGASRRDFLISGATVVAAAAVPTAMVGGREGAATAAAPGLTQGRRALNTITTKDGTQRVAKAVLVGAIPPLMLKTAANPGGLSIETFDQIRAAVLADRSQFWKDLTLPFYGYNRPGAKISEGVREAFWRQGMMAGFPAAYFCIKAFSETDLTEDLKKFDVPTLILHGDDDQIVPIADSALLSSKIIKNATLNVYKGASHGMCTTQKDQVNADLLAFFQGVS